MAPGHAGVGGTKRTIKGEGTERKERKKEGHSHSDRQPTVDPTANPPTNPNIRIFPSARTTGVAHQHALPGGVCHVIETTRVGTVATALRVDKEQKKGFLNLLVNFNYKMWVSSLTIS